ncbi:MAG: peptide ABC transporter substrate-binding protein [Candidatus Eremiobacteraeota bacterium]|nr:peptide ABC transporter substrate-binding protein [Candidatus Eremiobacteraeota bacterium]
MKRFSSLLLCAALLCAPACTKQAGGPSGPSGIWRIATQINPTQLNPILEQNSDENFIDGLIFSELVTLDDRGREIPDLAEAVPTAANGGISKDGLTITYHLRKNAKWQDGVAVTSRDVKFTWQAIMNRSNNVVSHHGYDQIASIDTPDDRTVVMRMKRVFPPAVDTIFGESDQPYRILPEHLLAKYPNLNNVPFNASPVGSGPFKFARWERNDRVVLDANPDYFLGAPKLKQIVIRIVPDANTEESLLRTGDIDLVTQATGSLYNNVKTDTRLVRQLVKAPVWFGILFNLQHPPLNDPAVRRAIALAIDKNEIVRKSTYGSAIVAIADQTDFSWAYPGGLKPLPFDLSQARAILDADGWKAGADGIRRKNGQPLSPQIAFPLGSASVQAMVEQMQQMLRQAGIDIQLKGYDYQLLYASAQTGGIYNSGKFDIATYSWVAGADPDDSSQFLCSMQPPSGNNIMHYCSSEMEALQRVALSTFDRGRRRAAYLRIQELLLHDAPGVFVYDQRQRYVHSPDLQNFTPNGISEGWNAYQWNR